MFITDLVSRNFPEDLGRLSSLKELMANGNRLQYLPDSFGSLMSKQYIKWWKYVKWWKLQRQNSVRNLSPKGCMYATHSLVPYLDLLYVFPCKLISMNFRLNVQRSEKDPASILSICRLLLWTKGFYSNYSIQIAFHRADIYQLCLEVGGRLAYLISKTCYLHLQPPLVAQL